MKLEFLLSRLATFGVFAAAIGLALNAVALALFAGSVGFFVLLITAGDYAQRPSYTANPGSATAAIESLPRQASLPLAA